MKYLRLIASIFSPPSNVNIQFASTGTGLPRCHTIVAPASDTANRNLMTRTTKFNVRGITIAKTEVARGSARLIKRTLWFAPHYAELIMKAINSRATGRTLRSTSLMDIKSGLKLCNELENCISERILGRSRGY
jgi:hypothetical protein